MTGPLPHLFVDISSHGFGHLAQVAPVLNALRVELPDLRLTVRSGLPEERLRSRLHGDFLHIAARSDFGYVMRDAVSIDHAATALAYRAAHANWPLRVAAEADALTTLRPDLVLTDVSYLPLAGAENAGVPSLTMSSLNWADLFAHFYAHEPWAPAIHREMLAAYNSAEAFLRLTPAMPMRSLLRTQAVAPVAALGQDRRSELRARLGCRPQERLVLVAFGGVDMELSVQHWPLDETLRWLVPASWPVARPDMNAIEALAMPFPDVLRSADAVLTKPGYGIFTEAACNATPVLFIRRDDWPEQDCLIDWLQKNARCGEIREDELGSPRLQEALTGLWQQPVRPAPLARGALEAAVFIAARLRAGNRSA